MGCDIHTLIEYRKTPDSPWEETHFPEYDWNEPDITKRGYEYECRNYAWFGVLAGVRDRLGKDPIAEFRGFPSDSRLEKAAFHEPYLGDHSFTHVYLRELMEYPWDKAQVEHERTIEFDTFADWLAKGSDDKSPLNYVPIAVTRTNVVPEEEAREIIARGGVPSFDEGWYSDEVTMPENLYVRVNISYTVGQAVGDIHLRWIEFLSTLGDPDNVRVLIGFDS